MMEFFYGEMQPYYCYLAGTKQWNPELPLATVAIQVRNELGASAQATVGKQHNPRNEPFMNIMELGPEVSVVTIMHEFGHIMGKRSGHRY